MPHANTPFPMITIPCVSCVFFAYCLGNQSQNRDRFTHRYCMEWAVNMEKEKNAFSCIVSVTAKDALRTLHDTRTEEAKYLGGESAVTLGGVGGIQDLDGLLHSIREWTGPKVRGELSSRDNGLVLCEATFSVGFASQGCSSDRWFRVSVG